MNLLLSWEEKRKRIWLRGYFWGLLVGYVLGCLWCGWHLQ